ncbi:MAG: beta-lactamase family protein [Syntrophomonadaceae bacterium]|nr:beta-lactamase family protein [Syntrophomonadaceae bacterium]
MKTINHDKLDQIIKNVTTKKYIYGAVFNVSTGDERQNWCGASGNIKIDSRYFIASINKLFISSIILKLIAEGKMSFEDSLSKYLPGNLIAGLHVYRGKDYSNDITILHMLSQTSGLPCYLLDKPQNGISGMKELEAGIDSPWPTEKVIERIKTMKPHFPPGEGKKAKYIDTNHQLLNLVIENITGMPIITVLNQLFSDLDMPNTYVCEDLNDVSYVFPYFKDKQGNISRYLTSTHNDIISTAQDQMRFIKAFFSGYFFPKEQLKTLEKWKPIFFPFQYGVGIQKFYMPCYLSPFKAVPDMIGHCGSTGSVAFYIPDIDLYITGTTNQQARPNVAFQTMIKIVHSLQ